MNIWRTHTHTYTKPDFCFRNMKILIIQLQQIRKIHKAFICFLLKLVGRYYIYIMNNSNDVNTEWVKKRKH